VLQLFLSGAIALGIGGLARVTEASDWPQVQRNPAHTGYTPDQPSAPYNLKWQVVLDEPTHNTVQPIVAEGKVFVTTGHGFVRAYDRNTGGPVWSFKSGAPLLASAAWSGGVLYAAGMDRRCYALRATDGTKIWEFQARAGFWTAPVVADGHVFLAGRDGYVYALRLDGTLAWQWALGSPIMMTPAYAGPAAAPVARPGARQASSGQNGTLYVPCGDMRVYAFDARRGGPPLWKSPKMPGEAMRDYWLVVSHGRVIVPLQPAKNFAGELEREVLRPFRNQYGEEAVMDEQREDEPDNGIFDEFRNYMREHPSCKQYVVLHAETGEETSFFPVLRVYGGQCIGHPPAVTPDGYAYLVYESIRTGGSAPAFFGRFHLEREIFEPVMKNKYGPINRFAYPTGIPAPGATWNKSDFSGGFHVGDQSWTVAVGGKFAFCVRDPGWDSPFYNIVDLSQRDDVGRLPGEKESGNFGADCHTTASPVAISGKNIFHLSIRSVLYCWEGQ
jgi:hypothetical protein